jgi:hypothetical protein
MMSDNISCDNCGQTWPETEIDPIYDYWGRVEPGGVVPRGQCPNPDCRALCYPAYGYVHNLEQQLAALQDAVSQLLDWAQALGGWEAPVWEQAREALARSAGREPDATLLTEEREE